jgi:hypothetical protein
MMDGASYELLTRAALASDEDSGRRGGDLRDDLVDPCHSGVASDDPAEAVLAIDGQRSEFRLET